MKMRKQTMQSQIQARTKASFGRFRIALALTTLLLFLGVSAHAVRIKDVTHIEGVRENQLIGYGLVVGLNGTGDGSSTEFTVRSLVSFLRRSGVTIDPSLVKVDNTAAVVVTADLPPFSRSGMRLDVTVSSIGDADSLQGGTLLMTPLSGPDGKVYAVAQGAVSVGGFDSGSGGTSVTKNHVTAGKVPGGGLIEKEPPTTLEGRSSLNLILDNPDFTTAQRIAEVINQNLGSNGAQARDSMVVSVPLPAGFQGTTADFLAQIERLPVHPDQRSRVVIDERTGTVVMGEDVRISTLAISHGNLTVQISQTNQVSQPQPFSETGMTTPYSNVDVAVQEDGGKGGKDGKSGPNLTVVPEGVSLGEVVQSLNAIGVTPRDLISILQSMKAAGALQAELVIR